MSTKRIWILILILGIMFVLLLKAGFNSIQEVSVSLTFSKVNQMAGFETEEAFLEAYGEVEFGEGFRLIDTRFLFINHDTLKVMYYDGQIHEGHYDEIPMDIRYGNSYYTTINNHKTLILNTDEELGDIRVRMVLEGYKHSHMTISQLNPEKFVYYSELEESGQLRFLRSKMIESLLTGLEDNNLVQFKLYYTLWKDHVGDGANDITKYDLYEGELLYVQLQISSLLEGPYNLKDVVEECKINGIFNKEDEYALIGMLLYHYMEADSDVNQSVEQLIASVPLVYEDINTSEQEEYKKNYQAYLQQISLQANQISTKKPNYSYEEVTGERYDKTFYLKDNFYLYTNYYAKMKDGSIITNDYIIVKIEPYRIKYYLQIDD